MLNKDYRKRIVDEKIKQYLEVFGAICIEGPKWCGKTWTCENVAGSKYEVADPSGGFQNRKLAEIDPSGILEGDSPRLIDEWQEVPGIWDAVRFAVDKIPEPGQFLLTGS